MGANPRFEAFADNVPPAYEKRPELALAALLYLMSRFPERRSPALAASVVAHLRMVASDERLDAALRDCATGVLDDWRRFALLCAGDSTVSEGWMPS